jgi:hypothetical protein
MPALGMTQLACVSAGGERFEVTVAIGHPYPTSDHDWACPVEIDGLPGSIADIHGLDSLQAICLAIGLVGERLAAFEATGGRLLHQSTGEPFRFDAYFGTVRSRPARE